MVFIKALRIAFYLFVRILTTVTAFDVYDSDEVIMDQGTLDWSSQLNRGIVLRALVALFHFYCSSNRCIENAD